MWRRWCIRTLCAALLAGSLVGSNGMAVAAVPQPVPRIIEVTAREHRFSPRLIQVQAGERVTIRLKNAGREQHEWESEALKAEIKPVAPGQTGEVTFTAPTRPGTYEFACFVEEHAAKGMKGLVVVK